MIRATTGGVMKTYRSNLMNSFINMNKSMNTILSQRTFNSFAEDPAAAAKAFRLRKSRMTLESQYSICTDTMGKYQQAVSCLQSVDDVLCTKNGEYGYYMRTLTGTTLSMLNSPTGDAREQLTKVLDQMSQEIIQTMNQKYGDNFIFAGADGHNVPFEIRQVDGKDRLYYRGVPVDAAIPNVLMNGNGSFVAVDENGQLIDDPDTFPGQVYYLNMDNVKTISEAEYKALYELPEVEMEAADPDVPVEYNADGSVYISDEDDPNYDPEQVGGYYAIKDSLDGDNKATETISKAKYEAIKERRENTKFLSEDDGSGNGTTQFVSVNRDGTIAENGDGGFYRILDKGQLITRESYEQQKLDYEKLQYLAQETQFVDIGFGFQEDPVTGKLIETSAFNAALNGINFIGYGLDEDGDPKNLYSLVQKLRAVSDTASANDSWTADWDEFNRLVGKFENAVSKYQTEYVNLDASTGKLSSQEELLVENVDNVWEQYSNIEDVDMAEAITAFLWAQYSYNAALRVGNSVLSQSLMDYLS